jgi:hypothetical protein
VSHVAHLRSDSGVGTACGEPWQGWQAPHDLDIRDPRAITLAPHSEPRPHKDKIRQCQACRRVALSRIRHKLHERDKAQEIVPEQAATAGEDAQATEGTGSS